MRFGPLPEDEKERRAKRLADIPFTGERLRKMSQNFRFVRQITKEDLEKLYHVEGLTQGQIAERFGVSLSCVSQWMKRFGLRLTEAQRAKKIQGKRHVHHKGGKLSRGYKIIASRSHPNATKNGGVCEHRLVVEQFLGRHLEKQEQVHHLNFVRMDNRIENFILFGSNSDHCKFHQWLQRAGVYFLGIAPTAPVPLKYEHPVLLSGKWVYEINIHTWNRMASAA